MSGNQLTQINANYYAVQSLSVVHDHLNLYQTSEFIRIKFGLFNCLICFCFCFCFLFFVFCFLLFVVVVVFFFHCVFSFVCLFFLFVRFYVISFYVFFLLPLYSSYLFKPQIDFIIQHFALNWFPCCGNVSK